MTAENVSADYKVSRADQDQFAFESNQKAVKAISGGLFKNEIIPIKVQSRSPKEGGKVDIKEITIDADEGPRADTTVEALGKLRPAFLQSGGSVTAGNSSQMSEVRKNKTFCWSVTDIVLQDRNADRPFGT